MSHTSPQQIRRMQAIVRLKIAMDRAEEALRKRTEEEHEPEEEHRQKVASGVG